MRPYDQSGTRLHARRCGILALGALALGVTAFVGCTEPLINSQSPEEEFAQLETSSAITVRDYARPYGMQPLKIEGITLVTQLGGTGSDPAPSVVRTALVTEMRTRDVPDPNTILASPDTALVLATGYLRPGIQKGDRFDIMLQSPPRSGTTSLRGGFMMEVRMTELALVGSQLHDGRLLALARGPILVDPSPDAGGSDALLHGIVPGGGVALESRDLGLMFKESRRSPRNTSKVAAAVNARFQVYERGIQQGVATAHDDRYVSLKVHPRYKNNVGRYMAVVRSIALDESIGEQTIRMRLQERLLADPITSARAALELEAIGREAVDVLAKGVESSNPEVRFYSAEALAYLDDPRAAEPLARAAQQEPAFRALGLTALGSMNDVAAYDALRKLLDAESAETRYGAFRALWSLESKDPLVRGEMLGGKLSYHLIATTGPKMVHMTSTFRPEIVLFGPDQRLLTPFALEAGKHITINGHGPREVVVSYLSLDQKSNRRVTVGDRLDDVIRAIVEVGGDYADVAEALQNAKASGVLESRLEVDALPRYDAKYRRKESTADYHVASPTADLFARPDEKPSAGPNGPKPAVDAWDETSDEGGKTDEFDEEDAPRRRGFLDRITPWRNR